LAKVDAAHTPRTGAQEPAPRRFTLEYLGFRNAADRREYVLRARSGPDAREFTVWIAHTAFAARQALLQDGPDICFQKLQRELALVAWSGDACVGVTEADLASYRAAHAPPVRQPSIPKPVPPAQGVWMSASSPPSPDGRG